MIDRPRRLLSLRGFRGRKEDTRRPETSPRPSTPREVPENPGEWLHFVGTVSDDEAAAAAEGLEAREGLSLEWVLSLADYWRSIGNWRGVKRLLQRAQGINPDQLHVHLLQADIHGRSHKPHLEKVSLEAALELVPDDEAELRRTIRLRLAAVEIQQHAYAEALRILESYDPTLLSENEVLNLAYCASRGGNLSLADQAYEQVAPGGDGGFDVTTAAEMQLKRFQRTDEALRLLDLPSNDDDGPRWLDVKHRALLLSGQVEQALDTLKNACAKPGHGVRAIHALGQLLELQGHPDEALEAYRRGNARKSSAFLRFRAGALLISQQSDYQGATEYYLSAFKSPQPLAEETFANEVDPQVPHFVRQLKRSRQAADRLTHLEQLFKRLSHQPAITTVGLELARTYLDVDRAADAWRVIEIVQEERLPAVSLRRSGRLASLTLETQYAEMQETLRVDESLVYWESNLGDSTSCNPLAICLALLDDPAYAHFTHVWSVHPHTILHPDLLGRPNVVFVARDSVSHARVLATAKYLVDNSTFTWYFAKREEQRVLSTWHGVPWKTLGKDNATGRYTSTGMIRVAVAADLITAPDRHTVDVLTKRTGAHRLVTASLMQTDYPRNDLAVNLERGTKAKIRRTLRLRRNERLVLFMPTWRGTLQQRSAEVESTLERVRELSGAGYRVVLRAHHYVREAFTPETQPDDIVFAPEDIDTYELLGAADALVTDFSSVLFDGAALRIPVIKLVEDIESYQVERGLYFSADEIPGANASDTASARSLLSEALQDPLTFTSRYDTQTQRFGGFASGRAAQDVIDVFFGGNAPKRTFATDANSARPLVLLHAGGLLPNGITSSLRNLVSSISSYVDAHISARTRAFQEADPDLLRELDSLGTTLPRPAGLVATRMQIEALRYLNNPRFATSQLVIDQLESALRHMAQRYFGRANFEAAVDFAGYSPILGALFALGFKNRTKKRGYVLHNDYAEETRIRFPFLASTIALLDQFDFVASVSDGLRDQNARTIETRLPHASIEQITLPNTLDLTRIRNGGEATLEQAHLDWYARPGRHVIVLGRFSPEKNHEMLLTALHTYLQQSDAKPISISFLGDGPDRITIENQATKLGLDSHVRFLGQVSNPFNHLRAADALYLPSRYEGQPMVLLEALTLGTAAVATDIPGSRSVLRDGELGSLVPLSPEGVLEGVRLIAEGEATQSEAFDADAYNLEAVRIFLTAIGVDMAETLTPHQMPPDPQPAS